MPYPEREKGTKICMAVTKEGVKVYGNKQAFRTLARWMQWLADSKASEHYECHLGWHLSDYESKNGSKPSNIWALFDKDTLGAFKQHSGEEDGFELTFMVVEKHDLDEMAKNRESGIVPENFLKGESK